MRMVIREQFHLGGYGIWLFDEHIERGIRVRRVGVPTQVKFVDCESSTLPEPTFQISGEFMAGLLASGPAEFEASGLSKELGSTHAKEMIAVQKHLEDMRKLVFKG